MKIILGFLLFVSFLIHAQDINKIVIDERTNKPMLIGLCDRTAFADTNFSWWFEPEYEFYEFDPAIVDTLKQIITNDISIIIVLGTWCSDSKREVPHFIRILDEVGFDFNYIEILCVNRKKTIDDFELSNLDIELVPTFIIYKDKIEVGRIIETPATTLEQDLIAILNPSKKHLKKD